jgi:uncharacterized protein (TIGR02246 family)
MRSFVILIAPVALLVVVTLGTAQEKTAPKVGAKSNTTTPAAKPAAPVNGKADEEAIRQAVTTYAKAYSKGDARGVAALFTADAEYVDDEGHVVQGRDAIEKTLADAFAETPGCQLEAIIESIRFIGPGAAVEDGTATVTPPKGGAPVNSRYTAVHLKSDGKWLIASVRDQAPAGGREHGEKVKDLAWLVGDWVDEGPDSVMLFSCRSSENGNYLLRDFTIKVAGHDAMNGSQRIGWDPQSRRLRTWTFDSEGGFSDGVWHRDEESWVLKSHGVTADGEPSSATSIFTYVNPHTMTWQATDVVIGGVRLPDTGVIQVVRKPPQPKHVNKD